MFAGIDAAAGELELRARLRLKGQQHLVTAMDQGIDAGTEGVALTRSNRIAVAP